jgi:acyl-[acyl-carrier-protein]-phospholipid O-acyltransferase/long-chain-fatty-acid--[acyl-carrier-protein] ligase
LHTLDEPKVDEALERLGTLGLPNLFIPRRENFIKVDKIPMLGTGKLDLRGIRRVAEEAMEAKETVKV